MSQSASQPQSKKGYKKRLCLERKTVTEAENTVHGLSFALDWILVSQSKEWADGKRAEIEGLARNYVQYITPVNGLCELTLMVYEYINHSVTSGATDRDSRLKSRHLVFRAFFFLVVKGPRSRCYGRTAAMRLIVQPYDEDEDDDYFL
jgi:hypothetical protein